ncbi:aldose 1-epimerase [Palleronia marisminoris]|uniref:Aldose 1-epimerase n=1 Tax=Palleronia marisminoris TaxID=315423 RepID=A0A1Y5RI09_9RHOB|nr:aldose epimerase family protein [Palleronia marisminoris]SFG22650.1 aldose 1-epimerase [Palleronia marisminoris]SLN18061.1 Aldose 1-epimerase [Palleronia marisminoris]
MSDNPQDFLSGTLPDGRTIRRVTLDNGTLTAVILDFGAALQDLRLSGVDFPLVLGSPDAAAYGRIMSIFGTVIGPLANRVGGAEAEIAGEPHRFEVNENGRNTLHSGAASTHRKTWEIESQTNTEVTLRIDLQGGEGGFPGNKVIRSRYALEGDTLVHELTGTTDAVTLMNLAHHGFWTAQPPHGWGGQRLTIHADAYLPTDDDTLPTGEIRPVEGTEFDFRSPRTLDPATDPDFDHNFCLARAAGPMRPALRLESPEAGVALDMATTAPGLQVFGMHKFAVEGEETIHGHDYPLHAAFAFEPQFWPDAPGRAEWPSIDLKPGETYSQVATWRVTRL